MKVLIIGHGLAGVLLGYFLERQGVDCTYVDAPDQTAAGAAAAGIINPITGRRYVKAWRVAELLPFARQTYRALEKEIGIQCYHEPPLVRTLFNRGEENDWRARMLEDDYAPYYHDPPELGAIPTLTEPAFAYLQVAQTARVGIGVLVDALRERHRAAGRLLEKVFFPEDLELFKNGARYARQTFTHVLFCEGWRARFNPWFAHLPHGGNKGEVLLIRLPEHRLERMFKHRVFIVPYEDDLYWVGATSDNRFEDDRPTPAGANYLRDRLDEVLKVPYEIVDHRAGVRPTVRDRRPLLGLHPHVPYLGIFNGLGTKGASLAPYWAEHFARHLVYGTPLDSAVAIARFHE